MKTTNKLNMLYCGMLFVLGGVLLAAAESADDMRNRCRTERSACKKYCDNIKPALSKDKLHACKVLCDEDFKTCLRGEGKYQSPYKLEEEARKNPPIAPVPPKK
jgi:hypothetical protein